MLNASTAALCLWAVVGLTGVVEGQTLSHYRAFELGSGVHAVSALAGVKPSDAKTLHQRPSVLQELETRPARWTAGSSQESSDPVEQLLFSFYDDQLYRIVIDYGLRRTEGMTRGDMVAGVAAVYGTPSSRPTPAATRVGSRLDAESGTPLARWEQGDIFVVLYAAESRGAAYRLVVVDGRLDDLARRAEGRALSLDAQEAPRREVARQKKERDDKLAADARARADNRDAFRP